jgi:hypothetical protein
MSFLLCVCSDYTRLKKERWLKNAKIRELGAVPGANRKASALAARMLFVRIKKRN